MHVYNDSENIHEGLVHFRSVIHGNTISLCMFLKIGSIIHYITYDMINPIVTAHGIGIALLHYWTLLGENDL